MTNCCFSNSSCNSTNRAASSSVCSPHLMLMLARASHLLRRRRPRVNSKHITMPWTQTPFTQSRDALPCRVTIAAVASCRWMWRARTAGDAGDRSKTSRGRRRAFGIFPTRVARRKRSSTGARERYIPGVCTGANELFENDRRWHTSTTSLVHPDDYFWISNLKKK